MLNCNIQTLKSDAFATLGRQLNKSWQAPQG